MNSTFTGETMKRVYKHILAGAAVLAGGIGLSLSAHAKMTSTPGTLEEGDLLGGFTIIERASGNGCTGQGPGPGFQDCFATQQGVNEANGELPSDVIFKYNNDDGTSTGTYSTIDGNEFSVTLGDPDSGYLNWTYDQNTDDPGIHYFLIKQASSYALFHSETARVSWNGEIQNNLGYNSYSHLTWFNSERHEVPEPAALGLFGIGLAGLGFAARRRRKA